MKDGKYWDVSVNDQAGCTKVGEGCRNCWAEKMACRLRGLASKTATI